MDPWESEQYSTLEETSFSDDKLLDNILDTFDEAGYSQRNGHQRQRSLAHTMKNPLNEFSHFDMPKEPPARTPIPTNIAQSPSVTPVATEKKPAILPSGRRRISKEQTRILEESFQKHTHLDKVERERVCKATGLMPKNVNIWFQNRRQKAKSQANNQAKQRDQRSSAVPPEQRSEQSERFYAKQEKTPQNRVKTPSTPLQTPAYRTPTSQKRNSAVYMHGSPQDMQKPLMSPAVQQQLGRDVGYFGLGVSSFETPGSPTPAHYSPTSTLGDYSPAQPFPQYSSGSGFWDTSIDQQWALSGRVSPTQRTPGRKYSLMQSPHLALGSVSSPNVRDYRSDSRNSRSEVDLRLSRSKSAVAIAPVEAYPELKRRRSNFGKIPTLSAYTAASSAQVSPNSSPPTIDEIDILSNDYVPPPDTTAAASSDTISAASAQRSAYNRARAYTQPSFRYENGMRLHLDDSNHQAVLVMVDQYGQQRVPMTAGSRSSIASSRLSSVDLVHPDQQLQQLQQPPMLQQDYVLDYDEHHQPPHQHQLDGGELEASQYFSYPSSDL